MTALLKELEGTSEARATTMTTEHAEKPYSSHPDSQIQTLCDIFGQKNPPGPAIVGMWAAKSAFVIFLGPYS